MIYLEMLQNTLHYVDEHLQEKLSAEALAARAGFSAYHFSRVFRFGTGYSVMEYVRNRRLAFAAAELATGRRILDIALEYGFETHSGFSKAFRHHFGCSPDTYRLHAHVRRPELPSLSVMKKYLLGGIVMEQKFVTRPAIKLVGYSIRTTSNGNENSRAIPAFWSDYYSDGRMEQLHGENFVKSHAEYGGCFMDDPESGEFEYVIGVEPREDASIPSRYRVREIPPATYAVFSSPPSTAADFVASVQGTWQYIFNEWFPGSGYEYAEGCVDFELYDERCMSDGNKVCDIYIPVSKKP